MLGQFVFTDVLIQVRLFHVAQGGGQPLAGQQPLVQIVPGAVGDEAAGGVAPLDIERPLCLPGRVQRQVICPAVERQCLLLQEQVEVVRGELVPEEVLDLRRLLHLPAVAVQVGEGLVAAPLGAENLAFRLLDLDRQHLRLVVPLVQAA